MKEARVKGIKLHREDLETGDKLWELGYDEVSSGESKYVCAMSWRTHAVDELDMWVQFKKWFARQNKGEPNNVIWIRM